MNIEADKMAALDRIRRRLEQEFWDVSKALADARDRLEQLEEELTTVARALDWAMHQKEETTNDSHR